jgi:hypothetical protein
LDFYAVEALVAHLQPRTEAFGVRRSSRAKRSASAAVAKRRYLLQQSFAGLAKNTSAGAV